MVAKTLYIKDATAAGGGAHGSLQDGGSAPATATTATGHRVAKTALGNYSLQVYNTERAANTFATTPIEPSTNPTTSDCFRTENVLTGAFVSANWTIAISGIAAGANVAGGRWGIRIWKGTAADGSNATQVTSARQITSTIAPTTAAAANATLTFNPGVFTCTGEYLFLQLGWEITTASSSNSSSIRIRTDGTNSKITTSDFTDILTTQSITTGEVFGTLTELLTVASGTISTGEAFGTSTVNIIVAPSSIASNETFGTLTESITVAASTVTTGETFGSPTVSAGATTLIPDNISSEEAFGSPTTIIIANPTAIASGELTTSPQINFTQTPNSIAPDETFGTARIVLSVSIGSITTQEAVGSPALVAGLITVEPNSIDSNETFGTLKTLTTQFPNSINSQETFGNSTIRASVGVSSINAQEAFGNPSLIGLVTLIPSSIVSLETFGTLKTIITQKPNSITSQETFGASSIVFKISPTFIASQETINQPRILFTARPTSISSGESIGSPNIAVNHNIILSGIDSAQTFGSLALRLILKSISITSQEQFGNPTVDVYEFIDLTDRATLIVIRQVAQPTFILPTINPSPAQNIDGLELISAIIDTNSHTETNITPNIIVGEKPVENTVNASNKVASIISRPNSSKIKPG